MFEVICINNKGTEFSVPFYSEWSKDKYIKKHKYSVNIIVKNVLKWY